MANFVSRCKSACTTMSKIYNLVPPVTIGVRNDYKCYSSLSQSPTGTRLLSCAPLTTTQNKPNNIAHLHTSCKKCEIFNIQDEEDFKTRVLNSKKAIIVDFHAKWCGPCKILMPRLETAVMASKGKIDLAKVDIDDLPDIAMEYNVGAVPSVLAIKNGSVVDKFVGLKDDDQIGTFIAAAAEK